MEDWLKIEVKKKTESLVQTIKEDELYKTYLVLSEKLKKNSEIMQLISEVKSLQKKIVQLEALGKKDDALNLDQEIKKKLDQLENYPLYTDFVDAQKELDQLFQLIKSILMDYFNEKTQ